MVNSLQLNKEQQDLMDKEVSPIILNATALVVTSPEESIIAQGHLKQIKQRRTTFYDKFDIPVKAAHKAWKSAKNLCNFFVDPFDQAERIIKRKIVVYEEKIRQDHMC